MRDAFEVFELEPSFELDEAALHRRLIELSARSHPDRFTDPIDQAEAAGRLAVVNEAYRVLSDPERRANALLERVGGATAVDDKALPPELLVAMMEVREELEEAIVSEDAGELARLRDWAEGQKREKLATVGVLFASFEGGEVDAAGVARRVRLELNALRYFQRMLDQMPG